MLLIKRSLATEIFHKKKKNYSKKKWCFQGWATWRYPQDNRMLPSIPETSFHFFTFSISYTRTSWTASTDNITCNNSVNKIMNKK